MKSTRFESSPATRAASFEISTSVTFAQGASPRQWPGARSITRSPRGVQETKRNGPVPIAAWPELNSAVLLSGAIRDETMNIRVMSCGSAACGAFVVMRIVKSSTIATPVMVRV